MCNIRADASVVAYSPVPEDSSRRSKARVIDDDAERKEKPELSAHGLDLVKTSINLNFRGSG